MERMIVTREMLTKSLIGKTIELEPGVRVTIRTAYHREITPDVFMDGVSEDGFYTQLVLPYGQQILVI